jgi:hypothetical protein
MLGGNYVNRFSIDGRSYKVIPQIQRSEIACGPAQRHYAEGLKMTSWYRCQLSPA